MTNPVAVTFIEFSDMKLADLTKKLVICLERLSEEQIWARGGAHENAVGNLMLHLCGNMRQWMLHSVGGVADVRERDAEFETMGGMSRAELIARFTSTVEEVHTVIAGVSAERLVEIIHPQGRTTSVLGAIYQVVTHVGEHVGQIILLTKQMGGTDLDLTLPRRR